MVVVVPLAGSAMPPLVRLVYGANYARRDGRRAADAVRRRAPARLRLDEVVPGLDRAAGAAHRRQAIEIVVLVPLVLVLGRPLGRDRRGRRRALGSSAAFWRASGRVGLLRLPAAAPPARRGRRGA